MLDKDYHPPRRRRSTWPIFLVLGIVFLLALLQVGRYVYEGWQAKQLSQRIRQTAVVVETTAAQIPETTMETETVATTEPEKIPEPPPIQVDFPQLQALNEDVMAWLYLPDSVINYPVMRSHDNEDYLHHLPDGSYNARGSIFMDCNNELGFLDDNIILYGHHMKDGSMFAGLEKYRKQDYYDSHPTMYLLTPDKNFRLEIFAAFVTDTYSDVYAVLYPHQEKINMLRNAVNLSDIVTTPRVTSDDTIVTLSTCAYYFEDARYVVQAVLKEM